MRTKLKRILSTVLACVMLLALLPASALAADNSTIKFTIENGYWKNLTTYGDASFDTASAVYDTDGNLVGYRTVIIQTTPYGSGYVYKCGGYMETMLNAAMSGNLSQFVVADPGYQLGTDTLQWSVNEGGGLLNYGIAQNHTANQQMSYIKNYPPYGGEPGGVHSFDDHKTPVDTFAENTVYKLTLTKVNYTVTYKAAANTTLTTDVTHTVQTGVSIPAAPSISANPGYSLGNWTLTFGTPGSDGKVGYTDLVYEISASLITYNIAYDLKGGTVAGTNPTTYTVTSDPITLINPTKDGYDFVGWTGTGLSGATQDVTIPTGSTGDRAYTAVWKENTATITYQAVGSGTVSSSSETVNINTGTPVGSTATATEGNYFVGWFTDEGCTVPVSDTYVSGTKLTPPRPTADITYYAKFATQETVVINVTGNSDSKEYNGSAQSVSGYTATYTVNGEASETLPAGIRIDLKNADAATITGTDVNTYSGTLSEDDFTVTNSTTKYVVQLNVTPGQLTITPKAVTITVTGNTDTKAYNGSEQTVEGFTVTGNPAGVSVVLKTGESAIARGTDVSDSDYMMGLSADKFNVTGASNYTVTLNVTDGWLRIVKAQRPDDAQIEAKDYNKPYDGDAHGITVNGATLPGDTVYYKTAETGWSTTAPTRTNVQSAETIYVKVENPNYITAFANATITITKREVTITVNNAEKYFDQEDPTFTGTVTGLVQDTDLGTITYSRSKGPSGDEGVGIYHDVLTASFTPNDNYNVTVIPGDFTIKTASVDGAAVTAIGGSRVYNGEPFAASAEVVNATGYTIYYSVDNGTTWNTAAPSVLDVDDGTVTVMVKATKTGYEDLTGNTVTIAITPRDVTLTSASASKVYDGTPLTDSTVTVGGSGFVKDEGAAYNVTGSQTKIGSSVNAFTYTLNSSTKASNYNITQKEGTLTVTAASGVTITKIPQQTSVLLGSTITWTVTVTNTSDVDAKGLILTDSISGVTITAPAGIDYRDFDLAAGESIEFTVTYKPEKTGLYINHVEVGQPKDGDTIEKIAEDDSNAVNVYKISLTPGQPALNTEDHVAYIIGYADGTVKPNNNITRAEVATIFFRLLTDDSRAAFWSQTNSYSDVSLNNWFNNAVSTLSNAGIISGYPNGTFNPNASITRAEFAAIATRFSNATYTGSCSFSDVPANHWAANAIALAEDLGWINGYSDGTFRPNQPITRAEAMTLINRVLERAVDRDHMLLTMVTWSDNQPGSWYYEAVQEATNSHTYSRTGIYVPSQSFCYENWLKVLEAPDWAALEKAWSTANSQ